MPITLPAAVAPNELIQSAWGNSVVAALDELDDEKLNLTGGTISSTLTVNGLLTAAAGILASHPSGGNSLLLRSSDETPKLKWQSLAGTDLATAIATATELTIDTLSSNPVVINAPASCRHTAGSVALSLSAATETPAMVLESLAGTDLLILRSSSTVSEIEAHDDLNITVGGTVALAIDGPTQRVRATGILEVDGTLDIDGAIDHDGATIAFYGAGGATQSTGWGAPTGTATKTTFATGSVTTAQLAERVKAIIDYLMARGDFST